MWISACCSAEPHPLFEMSGESDIGFIGICSHCKDNTEFEEEADNG